MPGISLVMPAFNEEGAIASTADRCLKALRDCTDDYELIILDDGSSDRTPQVMEEIKSRDPHHVIAIHHPKNMGIAATFEDLYRAATKEFVFLIPADGEYPPEALIRCMPLLQQGCDIVVCRRVSKNYTPYRKLISSAYRWCTFLLFGVDLYDPGSTKCMRRSIITGIPVHCTSVYVEAERVIRAVRRGHRIGVVDVDPELRRAGRARGARFATVYRAAIDMVQLWVSLIVLRQPA